MRSYTLSAACPLCVRVKQPQRCKYSCACTTHATKQITSQGNRALSDKSGPRSVKSGRERYGTGTGLTMWFSLPTASCRPVPSLVLFLPSTMPPHCCVLFPSRLFSVPLLAQLFPSHCIYLRTQFLPFHLPSPAVYPILFTFANTFSHSIYLRKQFVPFYLPSPTVSRKQVLPLYLPWT